MKCAIHSSIDTDISCSKCASALCNECNVGGAEPDAICSRCLAMAAVSDFGEDQLSREQQLEEWQQAKQNQVSTKRVIQISIVVAALLIVPFQLISLSSSEPIPLTTNMNDPEELTEECILNLLEISDLLQQGLLPETDFKCPASPDPYIITYQGDNIIVEDPHPELHGYSRMSVSKNNPFPEIVE